MAGYRLVPAAEADIESVLVYTLHEYGFDKYHDYAALIEEALAALATDPRVGQRREYVHPDARTYRIAKPGRNARHVFLYEIVDGRLLTSTACSTTPWTYQKGGVTEVLQSERRWLQPPRILVPATSVPRSPDPAPGSGPRAVRGAIR